MTRRYLVTVAVIAGALVTGGCGNVRESLGLVHNAPNEFNVVAHEPLEVPETLGYLPAPEPGAARPQESGPQERAEAELLGQQLETPDASAAETALVAMAGGAEPAIRTLIDEEHRALLADTSWLDDINFITDPGDPTAVLIDPDKERRRLQEIAALGLPINSGNFTDSILEEQEKALLEGLL